MSRKTAERSVQRRDFIKSALAVSGMAAAGSLAGASSAWAAASKAARTPLDPVNPDILFGTTSSIWRQSIWLSGGGTPEPERDLAFWIKRCAELGLQGIEPYGDQIEIWRSNPLGLKKLFDQAGITFIDASNGEKGQSTNFIDPAEIPKTIADHVAFARDFLQPLGADHFKVNMGARPTGGPTDEQLKRLANTLNELGQQTLKYGVRLAPHPHIWGPLEREKDMRRVMELTDPKYVWMTADTGHLELGGGDAVQIIKDYFPRVVEVHLKDTFAKYRGNTETPTQQMHNVASVYHNLGGGGVDFPALFQVLRDRHYKGWVVFDVDAPRKGDDGLSALGGDFNLAVDDYLAHNINYLRDVLGVKLPPPG